MGKYNRSEGWYRRSGGKYNRDELSKQTLIIVPNNRDHDCDKKKYDAEVLEFAKMADEIKVTSDDSFLYDVKEKLTIEHNSSDSANDIVLNSKKMNAYSHNDKMYNSNMQNYGTVIDHGYNSSRRSKRRTEMYGKRFKIIFPLLVFIVYALMKLIGK